MKKTILCTLTFLCYSYSNLYSMNGVFTYIIDQDKAKQETLTKDGISAAQLEQNIREKYRNIPEIVLMQNCSVSGMNTGIDAAFNSLDNKIYISQQNIPLESSHALTWSILHEAGHAQQPHNMTIIQGITTATNLLSLYFWGIHKQKPYKNIFTKISSKIVATLAIGCIVNWTLTRAEEGRADNWANAQADKEALLGGIETFETIKKNAQQNSQTTWDPLHPSIDSRIAKIKQALKNRFGVDA